MWIAKIKMKHDCLLGNRCKKFQVEATAYELGSNIKGKTKITNSVHQLFGEEKQIQKFIKDLKKDKEVLHLEYKNNNLFLVDKKPNTPVKNYNRDIFLASPVTIDKEGYESWEIGSFDREEINKFLNAMNNRVMNHWTTKTFPVKTGLGFYPTENYSPHIQKYINDPKKIFELDV
mgnify:CR=1 FL=1